MALSLKWLCNPEKLQCPFPRRQLNRQWADGSWSAAEQSLEPLFLEE